MTQFKVGDKVRVGGSGDSGYYTGRTLDGQSGVVVASPTDYMVSDSMTLVQFEGRTDLHNGYGLGDNRRGAHNKWYVTNDDLVLIATAKPTLADELRLCKSDRTILAHLKAGKEITPMKALVVYGLSRLAAHVHRIRQIGYNVETELMHDESGHKYASYKLETVTRCNA